MVIYASLVEAEDGTTRLLGLFQTKEKAVRRCLNEPSYSTFKWIQDSTQINCWHNNLGLFVKVKECTVE